MAEGLVRTQPGLWTILTPKWRSLLARSRQGSRDAAGKVILFTIIGGIFWLTVFGIAWRVLRSLQGTRDIGTLLAGKVLGLVLLAFLTILLLSNLISSLSTFFLARDLDLLVSAPVDWLRVYLAKLFETAVHSSWMVVLLAVPIFTAYGLVYDGGMLFPFVVTGALVPLLLMPAVVGSALTLLLVNVFPARRTRDLLGLVAIGVVGGLVLLLRIIRPEQLVRPEGFQNLMDFIAVLQAPTNPFLPSEWASQMVMNWLLRVSDPLPIALLWTTAGAFVVFGAAFHYRWYTAGYTRAQEGANQRRRTPTWRRLNALLRPLGALRRELLVKDVRLFFRDSTQWSQLILLGVLVIVYLFNIRALPLFSGERVPFFLVTIVAFLNMGLAGFVLAAIAARFIFPSFSLEGKQMWLLRSTPLDLRALLWSKYWIGTIPLLLLAVIITILTNTLLRVSPFMMAVSLGTTVFLTFALCALALMFGVLFPQFESENAAQIPTSFGGLLLMMSAVGLLAVVISMEARPVMLYLRAREYHRELPLDGALVGSLGAVAMLCTAATLVPLRIALSRMKKMEF